MKTDDDRDYEKGVGRGQEGDCATDFWQAMENQDGPESKGYHYGRKNNRDFWGRYYHRADGTGINDSKDSDDESRCVSSSSGGGSGGGGGGCMGCGCLLAVIAGAVIGLAALGNYSGKSKPRDIKNLAHSFKETQVSLEPKPVFLESYEWHMNNLEPIPRAKILPSPDIAIHSWLKKRLVKNPEIRRTLEGLALTIFRQTGGFRTTIYESCENMSNMWVAGDYSGHFAGQGTISYGFICHSSDNGMNWKRQWLSKPNEPDPVYGLYFSDLKEGWALSIQGILYTSNGGSSWQRVLKKFDLHNLLILDKNKMIVEGEHSRALYTGDGGKNWIDYTMRTEEGKHYLVQLKNSFNIENMHYGGVYSLKR